MIEIVVVGAGIAGCTAARVLADAGHKVIIVEKEKRIGGLCYQYIDKDTGILVHAYGAHIFHTNDAEVWSFMQRFSPWVGYQHRVVAYWQGALRVVPSYPDKQLYIEYTKKMWGDYKDMYNIAMKRLKMGRDDPRYFLDTYQGLPLYGYTYLMERMLDHPYIELVLGHEFVEQDGKGSEFFIYTGDLNSLCKDLPLPYRTMRIIHQKLTIGKFSDHPVINYPESHDYIRVVEHKWLQYSGHPNKKVTIVSCEYPIDYTTGLESERPMYPITTEENVKQAVLTQCKFSRLNTLFAGRLGKYAYLDMDQAVRSGMDAAREMIFRIDTKL